MNLLSTYVYVHHMHAWYLWRSEKGVGSLGPGVINGHETPCWCWALNPSPLQKQVLLTTEPSPAPLFQVFFLVKGLALVL